MRNSQLCKISCELLVVQVVEALRTIQDEDVQRRAILVFGRAFGEISRVVSKWQETQVSLS